MNRWVVPTAVFLVDLTFQIDAYRDGELPLWNPHDRAGYPFHRDPQPGVLYPVTWLLVGVGLVSGSTVALAMSFLAGSPPGFWIWSGFSSRG